MNFVLQAKVPPVNIERPLQPFYLTNVRSAHAEANECTISLHEILRGQFQEACLMNMMVDLPFLVANAPHLAEVKMVELLLLIV